MDLDLQGAGIGRGAADALEYARLPVCGALRPPEGVIIHRIYWICALLQGKDRGGRGPRPEGVHRRRIEAMWKAGSDYSSAVRE